MMFIVATYVIASRPPERRPTGTPHARANTEVESNKDLTFTWWFLKLNTTLCGWQLLSVVGDKHFLGRPAQLQERAIPPKENKAPKKDSHHPQGIGTTHRGMSLTLLPP